MDLLGALEDIKHLFTQDSIRMTKHEKIRTGIRELSPDTIKDTYQNKDIVGIIEQGPDVYKLWFIFTTDKDLNIVVRRYPEYLLLITVFECEKKKRLRPPYP
ncbi:MAG: hypothetical protein A3B06_03920 [Candidatus Yonathbacteria bacterium RIFCSPLOWO2_01_FULL_43_20]|nr:MAG: hypothetical protein A3B06_03920 [Candidatus Yonathbacteria bacterium RIFCSPLOWO2_01_FULL_43_20]HKZ42806.1 hypothetical protein [Candidatus Hodarchaeales archaeon]